MDVISIEGTSDVMELNWETTKQYFCKCMVVPRTVDCCAHVMTLFWYLSYGKYLSTLLTYPCSVFMQHFINMDYKKKTKHKIIVFVSLVFDIISLDKK